MDETNSYLNYPQYLQLLQPVNPVRVMTTQRQVHMESYDIRAHLNRIFGFARWSSEVLAMELVKEWTGKNSKGNDAVSVVYRAQVRLTVCAPDGTQLAVYTEWAAGDALGFPLGKAGGAHDFAIKTAESQALKRCAINLGDQFGLSLYNGGSKEALVLGTKNPVDEPPADLGDLPEITVEDTGEDHDPDAADGVVNAPPREPSAQDFAQFDAQLANVAGNAKGLGALLKWARNNNIPADRIQKINDQLAELAK